MHERGFYCHLAYVIGQFIFIGQTYLDYKFFDIPREFILVMMFLLLIYPLMYDGTQLLTQKFEYFKSFWNYVDMFHIFGGFINVVL